MEKVYVNGLLEQNVFGETKVVGTDAVFDDSLNKAQNVINQEVNQQLQQLAGSGSGNSGSGTSTTTVTVNISKENILDEDEEEEGIQISSAVTVNGTQATKEVLIPLATKNCMGIMSALDKDKLERVYANIHQLGVFQSSASAEQVAALPVNCGNTNYLFLYYTVVAESGHRHGIIFQQIAGTACTQYLFLDDALKKRVITFTDTTWTTVSNVGEWQEATATAQLAGLMSAADKNKLDGLPTMAQLNTLVGMDNFGIRFLGHMGTASSAGETAAAETAVAGSGLIKWVIYTYGEYTAIIHQTHNSTTTVQDMFFAGNKHSRRTITFTDSTKTEVSNVGAWTSISTDIGISRSATTATIKMVHPFMESATGLLSLVLGQATNQLAGLMTAEQNRTLAALDSGHEELVETVQELSNQMTQVQESLSSVIQRLDNLPNLYVLKRQLFATATPSSINIPMKDQSSSGGKVASNVSQRIQFAAFDEDENTVNVADCSLTWRFQDQNAANIFTVEYETGRSFIDFYASEDDYWPGNVVQTTLVVTLTEISTGISTEVTIDINKTNA